MNVDKLLETLIEFGTTYGLKVVGAILVLIVGRIVAGIVRKVIGNITHRAGTDPTVGKFAESLAYNLILVFAGLAALGNFGVQTASIVAVLGAAGFAVGFAMQGSLANFAAGVMLLIFRPFRIGDLIEAGGATGVVKDMTLFTTVINSLDNIRIIIPNGKVFGDTIKNVTVEPTRRVDMVVGIGYGSSIRKAKQVMDGLLAADNRVLCDPAPQIAVSELNDSSVDFVVRPWVKTEHYWDVMFDFKQQVKEAFDREGVEIPFPQTVVHLAKTAEA